MQVSGRHHSPCRFIPVLRAPITNWIVKWMNPQRRYGRFQENISRPYLHSEHDRFGVPTHNLVTVPSELSRIDICTYRCFNLSLTGFSNILLTPWCRVLLEQLTGLQLVKKFPAFHGTQRFITALTSIRHPSPILGQSNPVHILTSYLLEIRPNIIHPSTPRSPQWSLSLRFPHQDPIHSPLLTHTRHMPSPSHSSRFYHSHNIGWGVQII